MLGIPPGIPVTGEPQVGQNPRRISPPAVGHDREGPLESADFHGLGRKTHQAGVTATGLVLAVATLAVSGLHGIRADLVADGATPATATINRH